jgi:hypothetical protein
MQLFADNLLGFGTVSKARVGGLPHFSEWVLLVIAAVLLLAPLGAKAQLGGTGTIEGTVIDSAGALVPGAKVSARNIATGAETVRVTTGSGLYMLAPLDAGDYKLTEKATGFETLVRENIHVDGL